MPSLLDLVGENKHFAVDSRQHAKNGFCARREKDPVSSELNRREEGGMCATCCWQKENIR